MGPMYWYKSVKPITLEEISELANGIPILLLNGTVTHVDPEPRVIRYCRNVDGLFMDVLATRS
jgi:hypothetical protein